MWKRLSCIAMLGLVSLCAQQTGGGGGGGGGGTPAGPAGSVQLSGGSAFAADPLVGNANIAGGWYFSATADADGCGPNVAPAWFWGDCTGTSPTGLIVDTNLSGDLSAYQWVSSGLANYSQFAHTGSSLASITALYTNSEIIDSSTGPINQFIGVAMQIDNRGSANVAFAADSYTAVGNASVVATTIGSAYADYAAITTNNLGVITDGFEYYGIDMGGYAITNPYYSWFDSRGVGRCKEDDTFNAVGQSVCVVYNPQFAKYAPGAADYERIVYGQWESDRAVMGPEAGGTGTLRGLELTGSALFLDGITSGTAGSGNVVCADSVTHQIFLSSTKTDCTN